MKHLLNIRTYRKWKDKSLIELIQTKKELNIATD